MEPFRLSLILSLILPKSFFRLLKNPSLVEKAPLKLLEDDITLIKIFERNIYPFDTIVFGKDKKGPHWIEDEDSTSEKKTLSSCWLFSNVPQGAKFVSSDINKYESK